MEIVYPTCNLLQRLVLAAFADWEVAGRECVPPFGPLIIVANHPSNFDPSLISASVPRRVRFLAKDGIFKSPVASWFLRSYGVHPLRREQADIGAYRWVLGQLASDHAVVLFPEGTRSKGGMRKALSGVAHLALKSQAALLPVGIMGTARLGTVLRVFNPTGRIRVNIGTVFSVPPIEGKVSSEVLDSITEMIMQRVAALLPESYRGVYSLKGRGAASEPTPQ